MANTEKFNGVAIRMGGKDWIVPALSIGQVRRLMPEISKVTTSDSGAVLPDDVAQSALNIIHAALSRNYPDVTKEMLEDLIDLGNFRKIIEAIMGVSGLIASGEVTGEASR
jgi:hypothetical protein